MTRDLEHATARLAVARKVVAELLLDYAPDHQRVKDAKESVAGWVREVERLDRVDAALAADRTEEDGANEPA